MTLWFMVYMNAADGHKLQRTLSCITCPEFIPTTSHWLEFADLK